MKRAAAKRKTTPTAGDDIEQYMETFNAKRLFIAEAVNMSWRLAVTVVLPIVIGVKLDQRFASSPSFTLLGLMLAATAGCVVVWNAVKAVNRAQMEADQENNEENKD
jgi:F0F1-type ATP synthase assembly protein I